MAGNSYTTYWPGWLCERVHGAGVEGSPLRFVLGGWNRDSDYLRYRFGLDDRLFVLHCAGGLLYLIGRMRVVYKGTGEEWLREHPEDEPDLDRLRQGESHRYQLVVGDEGDIIRFDRAMPPPLLPDWRFLSADGKTERGLNGLREGFRLPRATAFKGVFRLSEATVETIDDVYAGRAVTEYSQAVGRAEALATELLESPDDRERAAVVADAWQQLGDPRGEILALELALADQPNKRLEKRLAKLVDQDRVRLIGRPGGFPFRAGWSPSSRR